VVEDDGAVRAIVGLELDAFDAVGAVLSGKQRPADRWLPGVVSGR